ncbi:methyl-accepting chemotaxis protein [Sphingomonas sp. RB3P16]|uniref:methyl-accepting chemotaxis protein n=1 Tax=Parasphingomonas frigoris TaxID=3096163 RepID=UPI002FCBE161
MSSTTPMQARGQMSLDRAIRLSGGALLGLMVVCGGTGLGAAWMQSDALVRRNEAAVLLSNHQLADMMHDAVRADVLAILESNDPSSGLKRSEISADFDEHLKALRKGIAADGAFDGSADVKAVTAQLPAPMQSYTDAAERIFAESGSDPTAARRNLPSFFVQFRALETSMAKASDAIITHAQRTSDRAETVGTTAIILLVIVLALGIAGTFAFVRLATRRVVRPIETLAATMRAMGGGNLDVAVEGAERGDELGDMAKAMLAFRNQLQAAEASKAAQAQLIVDSLGTGLTALADGDLTVEIDTDLQAPFTALKDNFNTAVRTLRALIGAVSESAGTIRTGSDEIARASEDLARRTETNAASLEQTSAAIAQMDQRLQATASAAARTVDRADGAMTTVADGRTVTAETVQVMMRVSESAKGIDDVIEGLDKIAFQTRVLAMNAAVEAGRAGDAGRGFAVVADLVSALAMRAEEEAGRAREQITTTQAEIGAAVSRVQQVDSALSNISSDVGEVHTLLAGIAGDNIAQSTAVTQVTAAVRAMDQATQQNAAMVEETSAAARNLATEVVALAQQTEKFTIGHAVRQPARSVAPPAPAPRIAKIASMAPKAATTRPRVIPAMAVAAGGGDDWTSF